MNARNDLDDQLSAFLRDGPTELPYESFDAVRDRTEQTRQRVVLGPWRLPEMNKFVTIAVGAAAVVVVLLVGAQVFGRFNGNIGGDNATPTPEATVQSTPSPTQATGVPPGPFLVFDPSIQPAPFDSGPPITVTITASGWEHLPENGVLVKGDSLDPPQSKSAALLTGDTGADGFFVYGDPCHWESTTPDTPARTVDEFVTALAAQASRDATAPVDVTIDGHAGKSITLQVPNIGATREEAFADCDQQNFATYGVEGIDGPTRYQQGPGQIDEFTILEVDGQIVVLDVTYGPATPTELVDDVRAMAASATFGTP